MEIGVIGINEYAMKLCKYWIKRGHTILFADVNLYPKGFNVVKELGPQVSLVLPEALIRATEIVILAVPRKGLQPALESIDLSHKIIIDMILEPEDRSGEYKASESTFNQIQWLLPDAKVIKVTPRHHPRILKPSPEQRDTLFSFSNHFLALRVIHWLVDGSGYKVIYLHHEGYTKLCNRVTYASFSSLVLSLGEKFYKENISIISN